MSTEEELLLEERALLAERQQAMMSMEQSVPESTDVYANPDTRPSSTEGYEEGYDQPNDALKGWSRYTGEPLNRGVIGMAELPVMGVNLASAGIYAADKWVSEQLFGPASESRSPNAPQMRYPISEMAEKAGFTAPEEERKEGLVPRAFEFIGASVIPAGAVLKLGQEAMKVTAPVPSLLQQMGRASASAPGKATAFDVAASFSAATGGTVARQFTDNETAIAMAELGFAFVPSVVALVPQLLAKWTATGKIHDKVLEVLAPYTEKGKFIGASRRLQDVAQDPKAAAAAIDPDSKLAPAMQTGDPGLIKLQNMILKRYPHIAKKYTEELQLAIDQLVRGADFGGDAGRARHILNVRSQMAVEEAALALKNLGPDATPRQISAAVRKSVEKALDDSVLVENQIWEKLKSDAPGNLDNAKAAYDAELTIRSPDAEEVMPPWLVAKLSERAIDDALMAQLQRAGIADQTGYIRPEVLAGLEQRGVITYKQRTFNDLKAIRSRTLGAMRNEKGRTDRPPDRDKLRVLGDIQEALLEDMRKTGVEGVDDAIAYTRALNERYRSGKVGRLLGYDKTGAERVEGEDLLNDVVLGVHRATNTQKLIEMSNQAPEEVLKFIRAKYIHSVYSSNLENPSRKFNLAAHRQFVSNLKDEGMFELFPELEAEFHLVRTKGLEALKLDVPESQVNTTQVNEGQSRAALLLQADPRKEMELILNSNHPVAAARSIMKRMHNSGWPISTPDQSAIRGLKSSLTQELLKRSGRQAIDADGRVIPNGEEFKKLIDDFEPVMRAFHMDDADIGKLNGIAEQIRLGQLTPGDADIGATILNNELAKPIEYLARYLGARTGGRLGDSAGSSIQLANVFSTESRKRLMKLTTSGAEELVIQALDDPILYKALLLGPRAGTEAQKRAEALIEAAILRSEMAGVQMLAIDSAQEITDE